MILTLMKVRQLTADCTRCERGQKSGSKHKHNFGVIDTETEERNNDSPQIVLDVEHDARTHRVEHTQTVHWYGIDLG